MKLLHTADWHIGKQLNGFDLLEEQWHAFTQIREIAKMEKVDGIIIAGDLFDRAIPSVSAVKALNEMFYLLNMEDGFPIYAVSGNHDSAQRLQFGGEWFERQHLHLATTIADALKPIETDTTQVFLLPFFDPIDARIYFEKEPDEIRTINDAMPLVINEMTTQFHPEKHQLLVTHFHVQGEANEAYELTSETTSTVGGLSAVAASHFQAFDYVALGHLHLYQASPNHKMRYSGSPVKFNTKEAKNQKGVYIVELDGELTTRFIPIQPKKDLIVLKGTYEELCSSEFYMQQPAKGSAFFSIKLTNRPLDQNPRQRLSEIYGDIVELHYLLEKTSGDMEIQHMRKRTSLNEEEMIATFYEEMTGQPLSDRQQEWMEETLISLRKEGGQS
ncbi:exonuclease SbcD [Vagococcus lutrae]|uniref:exonuclease SbcCD subunit D n=1 Tax=Vagococcus lutrae TaxID=81947 RepID=UPI0019270657|nr:exonuclease SbcCD subunit D [Vagococcus lutrae]GEQ60927.1 exonuclease SbcD [Vagococcus lutrae]GEQ62821.1 exonuclease SbcD [Vagococcus lutrae]GEQ64713.1 exonuclease SbcD [Vagococcus lutrae]